MKEKRSAVDGGSGGALGRRGFLTVTAAGLGVVAAALPTAEGGGVDDSSLPRPDPGASLSTPAAPPTPTPASQLTRAHWQERRVDHGETAHILVAAPGAADGATVTVAVYRVVGGFKRHAGTVTGRVQGEQARLEFRCAALGPVEGEGIQPLTFRARVGAGEERYFPPRPLEVLCTRPRFSA